MGPQSCNTINPYDIVMLHCFVLTFVLSSMVPERLAHCRLSEQNPINGDDELLELLS